ncbi:hypothetical protein LTR22_026572 [Elasticomyces elasticus]|nr:hypothetical protein LTR22_026572 [Elasticomyces elasticus]
MCDSRTGGKTVAAVLAERSSGKTIFWLATPTMIQLGTANHLDGLLRVILKMLRTDETHVQPLIDDIISRSVERSPQRIHHYGGRLTHLIESMVQGDGIGVVESLATYLKKLVMLRDVHDEFCAASYKFRHSPSFALLNQRIQRSNEYVVPRIRHFVGRLGYWHKTGTSLVRNARSFVPALSNARVEPIPWPVPEYQHRLAVDDRLERLALRVFPNHRETSHCDDLVSRMNQAQSLLMWFRTTKLVLRSPRRGGGIALPYVTKHRAHQRRPLHWV